MKRSCETRRDLNAASSNRNNAYFPSFFFVKLNLVKNSILRWEIQVKSSRISTASNALYFFIPWNSLCCCRTAHYCNSMILCFSNESVDLSFRYALLPLLRPVWIYTQDSYDCRQICDSFLFHSQYEKLFKKSKGKEVRISAGWHSACLGRYIHGTCHWNLFTCMTIQAIIHKHSCFVLWQQMRIHWILNLFYESLSYH